MARLFETLLRAFLLLDFYSTRFLASSVEPMFLTTGGASFIVFQPHELKKTTVCLGQAQSRCSNPLLYTQENLSGMKMNANRKYCLNPSNNEKRLVMSSKNNVRHLAVAPLSKIYSYGEKTWCWDYFSEDNPWVLLDCHFKTCWVSIKADGNSKQRAKTSYWPDIYNPFLGRDNE